MSLMGDLIKKLRRNSKKLYQSGWQDTEISQPSVVNTVWQTTSATEYDETNVKTVKFSREEDKREKKKPVEIVNDIITVEPVMNMVDLDRQIRVVARRMKVLKEEAGVAARDEEIALEFLKARKKYKKCQDLFRWSITTYAKVDELCRKYKVQRVSFKSFYKNVPMEAIDELEKYVKAYRKVRDDEPELTLIIDDGGKEQKKDPILLAGSPFGQWMYILGAWDKEILYVDDIIYHGK